MSSTDYKTPPQAPPLFNGTPESILADSEAYCDAKRALLDKLAEEVMPENAIFDNVLLPIAQHSNEYSRILSFYKSASPDPEVRKASVEAGKRRSAFMIECNMRDDYFQLIDAAYSNSKSLDAESERLLYHERRDLIRSGMGLPAGLEKQRLKEIWETLSVLKTDFKKNLDEENGGIWFSPTDLRGVPSDVLESFELGVGENEGKLKMTFKYPDFRPVMRYAQVSETRKRAFMGRQNRLPQNVSIFREAIALRAEAAQILGYSSHAEYKLETKMAKRPEIVMEFLDDLKSLALPLRSHEIQDLLKLKQTDSATQQSTVDDRLYQWDTSFYYRVLKEEKYALDPLKVAQYFPLIPTASAMLRLFGELFGLVFVEVQDSKDRVRISPTGNAEDIVWHEDVLLYSVWNSPGAQVDDRFVGYVYLDLCPRPGKYGHAACWCLQPGFLRPDGTRVFPVTAVLANFTKPTAEKPSLLKHHEVVTLFHEIGHGIHKLVARTTYSEHHDGTVRDFVEAPSQMLENWCWLPKMLQRFSSHYESGEAMPDELAGRIVRAKHVGDVHHVLSQLRHCYFDMAVHTMQPGDDEINLSKMYNQSLVELTGVEGPEVFGESWDWGHGYSGWGHLMGGYDSGYYGYLWSDVYAADMFHSVFKKDPLNTEQGLRYRRKVLEKGNSVDAMELLGDFLGRKPNAEAFFEELGMQHEHEQM